MSNKPESSASISKIESAKDYRKIDLALQRSCSVPPRDMGSARSDETRIVKIYQGVMALKKQVSPAFMQDHATPKDATPALIWLCQIRGDEDDRSPDQGSSSEQNRFDIAVV